MPRDAATLVDVVHALRRALAFASDTPTLDAFRADAKTQAAVLHTLLVLGEAVKRLSPAFREAHPGIPWRQMAGMRDVLIHAYDDVDVARVWYVLRDDLPDVLRNVEVIQQTD